MQFIKCQVQKSNIGGLYEKHGKYRCSWIAYKYEQCGVQVKKRSKKVVQSAQCNVLCYLDEVSCILICISVSKFVLHPCVRIPFLYKPTYHFSTPYTDERRYQLSVSQIHESNQHHKTRIKISFCYHAQV